MIIMWITNVELPSAARYRGQDTLVGGWMDFSSKLLAERDGIELYVVSMSGTTYDEIQIGNIHYCTFEPNNATQVIQKKIVELNPTIIHIWGSEYAHSWQSVVVAKELGALNNVVVSIQGLVSVYHEHYLLGLPYETIKKKSIYERMRKCSLIDLQRRMRENGRDEINVYKNIIHCIGRTDWDYACVRRINPKIYYHHCNEILRESFYKNLWNYKNCIKYKIAFSQAHYSIKGLHVILRALPLVKVFFPNVKLSILGESPFNKTGIVMKKTSYKEYIKKLIKEYNLFDNIEWVGKCNENQMINHYLSSNIFVCSSTIENSSNSIGEAMLLGMPVVASDVGGIKSLLRHEEEGLLYQADAYYMLADCIIKIFSDSSLAEYLGKNAKIRAKKTHDFNVNTDRLINIYRDIVKEKEY